MQDHAPPLTRDQREALALARHLRAEHPPVAHRIAQSDELRRLRDWHDWEHEWDGTPTHEVGL